MQNVKITMMDPILNIIAPHHCCGCGKIGTLLCQNCKYDIENNYFSACLSCRRPTGERGVCGRCRLPYSQAWCVGDRIDSLEQLINRYKFDRAKAASHQIVQLLLARLPELPADTTIVPIPTISSHIRQRGYDHMELIARQVAAKRKLTYLPVLRRVTNTTQHGSSRSQREEQAKHTFEAAGRIEPHRPYLLIDDIMTTGFTLHYAAQQLRDHGAQEVWVAVVARQPLD